MTGERWEGESILNAGLLRCHWPKQVTNFKAVECAILGKPKGDTLSSSPTTPQERDQPAHCEALSENFSSTRGYLDFYCLCLEMQVVATHLSYVAHMWFTYT